jgi:hypothetical protein
MKTKACQQYRRGRGVGIVVLKGAIASYSKEIENYHLAHKIAGLYTSRMIIEGID